MKSLTVCAFVALLVGGLAVPQDIASKWEAFKAEHGKQYSGDEDAKRMQIFAESLADIEAHNLRFAAGEESFSRQLNRYSDFTNEELDDPVSEFKFVDDETILTWNDSEVHSLGSHNFRGPVPDEYDAEKMGYVTPVKDRKCCDAIYAFIAVALLEAHIKRWKNKTLDLSEQEAIDCTYKNYDKNRANRGCKAGSPIFVLQHVIKHGIAAESVYPYTSGTTQTHGTCQKHKPRADLIVTDLKLHCAKVKSEEKLREALLIRGPFIVGFFLDKKNMHLLYDLKDGIFDVTNSHNAASNYAVLIVGYGTENGKPYWRFKNSRETSWGVGGYGKMARGKNMGNILNGVFCTLSSR